MSQRAIVIANGEIGDLSLMHTRLTGWEDALVVAADGGSRHALALGLRPLAIVGDFDSLDPAAPEAEGIHFEIAPAQKDETDLELALGYALAKNALRIVVLGATGLRLDMTIANVLLLLNPMPAGVRVELWAGTQTAWLIRPPGDDFGGQIGDTLSLIPLGRDASGITTQGLEYPLHDETLFIGYPRGVSNVLTEQQASVHLKEGAILAIHTPGKA